MAEPPQQIPLRYGSGVFTVLTQHRDTGILAGFHLLQCLSECIILIYISDFALRCQKKQDVHPKTPYLCSLIK